jgi:hypothetical protein
MALIRGLTIRTECFKQVSCYLRATDYYLKVETSSGFTRLMREAAITFLCVSSGKKKQPTIVLEFGYKM